MAAERPPITHAEILRILRTVRDLSEDKRIILIGGQAVAFWIVTLEAQLGEPVAGPTPGTSKDIDFEGNRDEAIEIAKRLGGHASIPDMDNHTPNSGVVEYIDSDGWPREIDFLDSPLGLTSKDVEASAVRLEVDDGEGGRVPLWVMHPERCVESRVANIMILGTLHPLALEQLRASIDSTRRFSGLLLDEGQRREVLDVNERLFRKSLRDPNFRRIYEQHGIDPFDGVLVDERLGDFVPIRYPQMRAALERRRAEDEARRSASA
jgi:hypothetical protein